LICVLNLQLGAVDICMIIQNFEFEEVIL